MDPAAFANQVVAECESTNDLARQLGESGAPHGTWVSARVQTRGRGRLGREWKAIEGNLFLSIVVRVPEARDWTWIPLLAGVAATQALRTACPGVDVRVKWPNDLWIDGAKLGGLLCEAVGSRERSFLIVGIGVNCVDSPQGLDQRTVSLTEAAGAPVNADVVRASVVRAIVDAVDRFLRDRDVTIESLRRDYAELAALPAGTEVTWKSGAARGEVLGLGALGELRVRLPDGSEERLYAEDVSVRLV